MAGNQIRVGIYGAGYWAEQVHVPGFLKSQFMLSGIWGRSRLRSQEVAKRGGIQAYASYHEMLAEVDAVSFAVPPNVQAKAALEALNLGKHVFLEKPIATSVSEADQIIEAADRNSVAAMVYLPKLFSKQVMEICRQANEISADHGFALMQSKVLEAGSPYASSPWRRDRFGAIWDLGPHVLSVLLATLGPVAQVTAGIVDETGFYLDMAHLNGVRSRAQVDLMAPIVAPSIEKYEFGNSDKKVELFNPSTDRLGPFAAALNSFADIVRDHRNYDNVHLARNITSVLHAACESVTLRKSVEIGAPGKPFISSMS